VLSIIISIGTLPILIGLAGNAIAAINDCQLNFADVYPCLIGGRDYGQLLHDTRAGYWLAIISVPFAGICILVYLFGVLLYYFTSPKKLNE
jgi:cytochrome c biogenesis protein CcdA